VPDDLRHALGLGILHSLVIAIARGEGEHYDGVRDTLSELAARGYLFYGVSNGRFPYIEAILRANGTYEFFTDVPTIDNRSIHDKTELVASVLRRSGLTPRQTVLIGDRTSDRDAALANRVPFIAATYGHGAPPEWEGAVRRIASIGELLELL
jgi:phosphoglycolate phosphatase